MSGDLRPGEHPQGGSPGGLLGRSWRATLLAWGSAALVGAPVWSLVHLWLGMDSSWTVPAGLLGVLVADALLLGGPAWWAAGVRARGLAMLLWVVSGVVLVVDVLNVLRGPHP